MLAVGLSGCSQTPAAPASSASSVMEPVVKNVNELQGATVRLSVGQALDIDTGDLAVDSYSGKVDDPAVAEFVAGRTSGGATFNPGVTALAAGSTKVTMSNTNGGIQNLTFTVDVSG